jgi:hypothetical protein
MLYLLALLRSSGNFRLPKSNDDFSIQLVPLLAPRLLEIRQKLLN